MQLTMLRTAKHKIVADHSNADGELYDLVADPRERRNLWNDPGTQNIKSDLLLQLCNRMADTVDPCPFARPRGEQFREKDTCLFQCNG